MHGTPAHLLRIRRRVAIALALRRRSVQAAVAVVHLITLSIRPRGVIREIALILDIAGRRPVAALLHLLADALGQVVLCADARQEVEEEGEDVEGEDEGNDPLEDGGDVLLGGEHGGGEDDGEDDLDEDEDEFDPEADAQDAVVAVVHAQALVLGADEDGADHVPRDEEEQEAVVQARVVVVVEDGEEDEAAGARDGEDDAEDGEDFLGRVGVADEGAFVAQPALRDEGGVEEDGRDDAAGDEEGFEAEGADVGDVGDGLASVHGWVVWVADDGPVDDHGHEHGEPHAAGDEGEDPVWG